MQPYQMYMYITYTYKLDVVWHVGTQTLDTHYSISDPCPARHETTNTVYQYQLPLPLSMLTTTLSNSFPTFGPRSKPRSYLTIAIISRKEFCCRYNLPWKDCQLCTFIIARHELKRKRDSGVGLVVAPAFSQPQLSKLRALTFLK